MLNRDAERNLLFVVLALQMDFVDGDQLVAAMQPWRLDPSQSPGDVLVRQGVLSEKRRGLLDEMVREHIQQHGGDVEKSLAAASSKDPIGTEIATGFLPDLPALLATLSVAADQSHRPRPDRETGPSDGERLAGGRFRVLELHAKGGLGQVMRARDEKLGRTVAVKEIQPQYADHPAAQDRFVLEAEITGGLEHPSIVPVYGLGKYRNGQPYYAMRFVRGDDLSHAIKRFHASEHDHGDPGARNVKLLQLLRRFTDVCNAVQYAHSRGVLHRDIKPGNVMLGKYGETLVVDWGLAKVVGRAESGADSDEPTPLPSSGGGSSATLVGSAIGTPAYVSPEQAAGDVEQLGPASDVYSLGATLYSVLTGRPAFTGSMQATLEWVQKGEFPPPREIKPEIPRPLAAICLKAMALSPSERYASPKKLVDDIEH